MPVFTPEGRDRFWRRVEKRGNDECWPWLGHRTGGYGTVDFFIEGKSRSMKAHRVAYFLHTEEDPREMGVCHRCDNPSCCNPSHFFLGTHDDNMADKARKGRVARASSKFTFEEVMQIRERAAAGGRVSFLAKELGVASESIRNIVNGTSYRNLPVLPRKPTPLGRIPKSQKPDHPATSTSN